MIAKEIVNRRTRQSKAGRATSLVTYVARLDTETAVYCEGTGFFSATVKGRMAEMAALAMEATRSVDPLMHLVLSWPVHERPTNAQCDAAVKRLLQSLGLAGHQCLYALHRDTDNWHLHMIVNRVDPLTGRPIEINKGFTRNALLSAVAEVESALSFEPERNAKFEILDGKPISRTAHPDAYRLTTGARRYEAKTGLASAQRIAIERAKPLMAGASSWQELHMGLADAGMRLQIEPGRGALVWVGNVAVKASSISRELCFPALERTLGPYQPAPPSIADGNRKDRPGDDERFHVELDPVLADYHRQRLTHEFAARQKRKERRHQHAKAIASLKQQQRDERTQVLAGSWAGFGRIRAGIVSVLAEEHRHQRDVLAAAHRDAMADLHQSLPRFPDFEAWKKQREPGAKIAVPTALNQKVGATVANQTRDVAKPKAASPEEPTRSMAARSPVSVTSSIPAHHSRDAEPASAEPVNAAKLARRYARRGSRGR